MLQVETSAPRISQSSLKQRLFEIFGFSEFRPHQEEVCQTVTDGFDTLLVMPTGAGKSLCYQLPGLARQRTALVISPLIALMEDQVAKLQALGLAAERIHSGRDRETSRQVCRDYLDGKLQFLFIAPERLSVPGFPEFLAKRPLGLIAIDEAHCISQWGHDFRPDYRLLSQRLPVLRPAPVIALTATATPRVQKDIAAQLGFSKTSKVFIHGFRRTNIAVEVIELSPKDRTAKVLKLLKSADRRPAIVYAPTRKSAELVATRLAQKYPAAAYHAGLPPEVRDSVQTAFIKGKLDVVVATIAFGMGIDKADVRTVVHTALPSSIESYYQEIGRAGRDGQAARAVLMYSFADQHTHRFLLESNYPDVDVLDAVFASLSSEWVLPEALLAQHEKHEATFVRALEKLRTHGGAEQSPEGEVRRGKADWRKPYLSAREQRVFQLAQMARFAESNHACRMLEMIRHFGDTSDTLKACGQCDVCAPDSAVASVWQAPDAQEKETLAEMLKAIAEAGQPTLGQLQQRVFGSKTHLERTALDRLLAGLLRAQLVRVTEDQFEKGGQTITFKRVMLLPGRKPSSTPTTDLDQIKLTPSETPAVRKRAKRS